MEQWDRRSAFPAWNRRLVLDWAGWSLSLRGLGALGAAALDLVGRYEYLGGHARNIGALGIVEPHLKHDGLDVALAPAHVALSGKVSLDAFEEDFAAGEGSPGQSHPKSIAISDMVGIGFRN